MRVVNAALRCWQLGNMILYRSVGVNFVGSDLAGSNDKFALT